jgi:hypothetical protein
MQESLVGKVNATAIHVKDVTVGSLTYLDNKLSIRVVNHKKDEESKYEKMGPSGGIKG